MKPAVLVLGSGPIRIGQGIEFDYSCVHCVWALQELGYRALILNNNPETVSTDFDTGDALYFDPVTAEDALAVARFEKPIGVVCQFGGQTAINLAAELERMGLPVLGTPPAAIAMAEDRRRFEALLESLGIARPPGRAVSCLEEAREIAGQIGYPVLVRPSFVLGGRAMEIVYGPVQLEDLYVAADAANPGQPILVDKYLVGTEVELDAICDGEGCLIPGLMEHIERAGVHSGDSMAAYPPPTLSWRTSAEMIVQASSIARALGVRGLMNIQYVIADGRPYVLEVNPRASRTVPFLSKVTGVQMVRLASRIMMGSTLESEGYRDGLWAGGAYSHGRVASLEEVRAGLGEPKFYAIKAPVFSFQKLARVEPTLGPEMKSTGEIMGIDRSYQAALYKALLAAGIVFGKGAALITVNDADKPRAIEVARALANQGHRILATHGTHSALLAAGVQAQRVNKISEGSPNILEHILGGGVQLLINTPSLDMEAEREALRIRRACIETGVACITSIDTASAIVAALDVFTDPSLAQCLPLAEYVN